MVQFSKGFQQNKLRNIVLNFKIFDRKFDRGLVGYSPGPQTVIANEKRAKILPPM